jgi:hypothetical protein
MGVESSFSKVSKFIVSNGMVLDSTRSISMVLFLRSHFIALRGFHQQVEQLVNINRKDGGSIYGSR